MQAIFNSGSLDAVSASALTPWLLAVVALLLALLLTRSVARRAPLRRRKRILRRLGADGIEKAVVPDGIDGFVFIDYLVLTPAGVLVLDIKDFRGNLFGGVQVEQWTQVLGHRSYRFDNPLYENQLRVQAVKALAPGVPVRGIVVFTPEGEFPRERPQGVYMLDTLLEELALPAGEIPAKLRDGWVQLKARLAQAGQSGAPAKKKHAA